MADAASRLSSIPIRFEREEWAEEVERLAARSRSRVQAEKARRELERGETALELRRCEVDGRDGTSLPRCAKVYVPLGRPGASEAPFGFVFQLARDADGALIWIFLAFGERHPANSATRTVYDRAHKRLHGRYP